MARENLKEVGIRLKERFVHHDQDTVYTGYRWLQAVLKREEEANFLLAGGRNLGGRSKCMQRFTKSSFKAHMHFM